MTGAVHEIGLTIALRHPSTPTDTTLFCARPTTAGHWRVFVDGGFLANGDDERHHANLASALDDLEGEVLALVDSIGEVF